MLCDLSSQLSLGQHNVFCVVDSNFFFNHLFTVKYSFSSVHQRIRNDFRQSLVSKDTKKATQCSQPYKQRRFRTSPSRTSVWWDNFVKEVFVTEEGRENFRMSRRNLLKLSKLLRPHIEGKTTRMRCPVDVTKKVACTLYYLSDKGRLRKTANAFGFSCQVVSKIIREVCRAVTPSLNSCRDGRSSKNFYNNHGFPQCFGAVEHFHSHDRIFLSSW